MEKTRVDLLLRCDCGYLKVLSTMLKQVEITKVDTPSEAKLPRPNTKLWNTIKVLEVMTEANSAKITERLVDLGEEDIPSEDWSRDVESTAKALEGVELKPNEVSQTLS